MADEKPIVPAESVVAAPAPAAVEAAPVVVEAPIPVVEAAPAPVVEAPAAPVVVAEPAVVVAEPAVVVAPEKQLNLLARFDKKTAEAAAAKPAEGEKPADGDKPAEVAEPPKEGDKPLEAEKPVEGEKKIEVEAAPVVVEPPKPIEYAYTLPENFALPEPMRDEFHGIMSEFAATPGNAETQQKLVDFHLARLTDGIQEYNRTMRQSWDDMNGKWAREVESDPVIGGNAIDSTMQAVAYVRDNFVSLEDRGTPAYEKAKADLDEMMELTGAGNHPAFIRLMHNISQVLNEPQMQASSDIKPIPQQEGNGRAPIYRTSISPRNGR